MSQAFDSGIFEETICYRVELSLPGCRRQVRKEQIGDQDDSTVRTDADPDEVMISKDILGSTEFEQVVAMDNAIRNFVRSRSLNARGRLKVLAKGVYLLPLGLIDDTDDEVHKLLNKRQNIINAFLKAYPKIIEGKKEKLKSLFDEDEFPDEGKLRAAFKSAISIFDFGVPERLGTINSRIFKRESEKAQVMWAQAARDVRDGLRAGFLDLVKRATVTLGKNEDGRKKRFHQSTVEQIDEFLNLFDKKNITHDAELTELVSAARKVFKGQGPREVWAKVSDNDDYRDKLQTQFQKIHDKLETLVEESDERMVEL